MNAINTIREQQNPDMNADNTFMTREEFMLLYLNASEETKQKIDELLRNA